MQIGQKFYNLKFLPFNSEILSLDITNLIAGTLESCDYFFKSIMGPFILGTKRTDTSIYLINFANNHLFLLPLLVWQLHSNIISVHMNFQMTSWYKKLSTLSIRIIYR